LVGISKHLVDEEDELSVGGFQVKDTLVEELRLQIAAQRTHW
jgi:hypothetical protein